MSRCLYNNSIEEFNNACADSILGDLVKHFHGVAPTTSIEAWEGEIAIMKGVLSSYADRKRKNYF